MVNAGNVEITDVISDVFAEIGKNKDLQREIDDTLAEHKIPRGTFIEILAHPEQIDQLDKTELCLLADTLFTATKNEAINPKNFYSEKDIAKAQKYKRVTEEPFSYPYTFEGVLKSSAQDFITVVSYQEISKLWNSRFLTYNFNVQRLSKKKLSKRDGKIIEKPDVNLKSVKNITKLMLEGKYKPDTILINIMVDGNDQVEYEDGDLTIGEGTTVNLIDGMHRVQAILAVIEQNPDFIGYINVSIKHYPLEEAQFLLGQVNTVNRFDKTLVKRFTADTIGAQITNDLMNTSELKGRISTKTSIDRKLNYLTNFAILSESIESIFEPQSNKDKWDITAVLKKFFEYLIPSFDEAFGKNMKEFAKTSWLNHHNTFVGFIVIAKKLYDKYGKDYPVDEIVRIVKSIDMSREGSEFNSLMTTQGKVNSNQVKKQIRKFFEEKVDQLLA